MKPGELVRMNTTFKRGSRSAIDRGEVVMLLGPSPELPQDVVYVMTPSGRQSYHVCYLEPLDETG